MHTAFRTNRKTFLTASLAKHDLAAFAAENDIAMSVDSRAAAQDRTFVHVAVRANRCTLFADVTFLLDISTLTAQRHLPLCMVRVRNSFRFFLAAGKRQHQRREHKRRQA
jgi:hypothetical protein